MSKTHSMGLKGSLLPLVEVQAAQNSVLSHIFDLEVTEVHP